SRVNREQCNFGINRDFRNPQFQFVSKTQGVRHASRVPFTPSMRTTTLFVDAQAPLRIGGTQIDSVLHIAVVKQHRKVSWARSRGTLDLATIPEGFAFHME